MEEHGFEGSYSSVQRWVKHWRLEHRAAGEGYTELVWAPGVAQVDYGQAVTHTAGESQVVHILVVSFPFSNTRFVVCSPGENAQCVCAGLRAIFEHIGRVPRRLVFDNATGVGHRRRDGRVTETRVFELFRLHYECEIRFTNPYSGNEKGNVENAVGFLRRNFMVPLTHTESLAGLSKSMLEKCDRLLANKHYRKGETIRELFTQDLQACRRLPGVGFVPVVWETRLADKVGNILVGDNRYQVGSEHAGKRLQVGIGDLDVTILDADGSHIACHKRVYPKQASTVTTPVKLLDGLIKRLGSWRESLLRGELPPVIVGVLDEMWNQGDKPGFRQFLRIIRTVSAETDYSQTIDTTQRLIMAGRDITLDALLMATKRQAHPDETQSNVADLSVYDQLVRQVAQ